MSVFSKRYFWILASAAAVLMVVVSGTPAGRDLAGRWLGALRVQKVQAVNLDLSPFADPNANPALHQMVSQMISDKVEVTLDEPINPSATEPPPALPRDFPFNYPTRERICRD